MSNLAIYQPKGKAGEYAAWACNFHVGCSNGCTYCYLKKGIGSKTLGGNKPTLKKCFKNETHALEVFQKELKANLPELQKHGLFFSFTTDPLLPETIELTIKACNICAINNVSVKILTKMADFAEPEIRQSHTYICFPYLIKEEYKKNIAFGFTLTGCDNLEPHASTNQERIEAMRKLHNAGFKIFASIEPIIDLKASLNVIDKSISFCDLYKIGLMSGQKTNKLFKNSLIQFITAVCNRSYIWYYKIYFKDSLLKAAGINRFQLPVNCVDRDYNLFI